MGTAKDLTWFWTATPSSRTSGSWKVGRNAWGKCFSRRQRTGGILKTTGTPRSMTRAQPSALPGPRKDTFMADTRVRPGEITAEITEMTITPGSSGSNVDRGCQHKDQSKNGRQPGYAIYPYH